ncbi:GAF and ANTAR domain-containing protein [Streptomyces sp. ISL-90]|nr:GAF and ANTAR domain-containing protein [Streptomyces sp. ISL-90]
MADRFAAAADALSQMDGDSSSLTTPILDIIPVTGAAVSTLGDFLGSETITASDAVAARIDELQFDLGEGPCWDALAGAVPMLEPDLRSTMARWPAFSEAVSAQSVGSLFAFPLIIGPLRIGALDLYAVQPMELGSRDAKRTEVFASIVSRHVLRRALREAGATDSGDDGRNSRRIIHQATGFVIAQLAISAEDAHLLIQGQAFSQGSSMREIAEDLIERRLTFELNDNSIEVER